MTPWFIFKFIFEILVSSFVFFYLILLYFYFVLYSVSEVELFKIVSRPLVKKLFRCTLFKVNTQWCPMTSLSSMFRNCPLQFLGEHMDWKWSFQIQSLYSFPFISFLGPLPLVLGWFGQWELWPRKETEIYVYSIPFSLSIVAGCFSRLDYSFSKVSLSTQSLFLDCSPTLAFQV